MANKLSIRGIDDLALAELKRRARQEDASVNGLVLRLIDQGLGPQLSKPGLQRKHDLDALAGQWQPADAAALQAATAPLAQLDPDLWK